MPEDSSQCRRIPSGTVRAHVHPVASLSSAYEPRAPDGSVLYAIVRDHLETFLAQARHQRDGEGVPRFVEQEFRDFLRCGWLAGGFARFRCGSCGTDRLIAFSCKARAVCPSCGGRRMTERAAHLVDHVFPDVPVRQWVLSLPHRVRYVLAWDHDVCRAVVAVSMRAILGFLRHRSREAGVVDPRGGAVVIVQRFGWALNVNVHFHALVLDGCFDEGGRFHPLPDLDAMDVAEVLATIVAGVRRLLARRGLADDDEHGGSADAWQDTEPALAGMAAASVEGRVALGPRAGRRIRRRGDPSAEAESAGPGPCHARQHGFDLHAAVRIRAGCRDRLERVIRYALRPPIAADRLRLTPEGQVLLALKRRWADGTTHLVFDPTELLERLAAITPRPRINLLLYYGVLGARSAWRAQVVPTRQGGDASEAIEDSRSPSSYLWAGLMQRSFGFDVLACARCGGRMRLVALIAAARDPTDSRPLGLSTEIPEPRPARDPPLLDPNLPSHWPEPAAPFEFDA